MEKSRVVEELDCALHGSMGLDLFEVDDDFLLLAELAFLGGFAVGAVWSAMGNDRPRSLPLLATPTPHVRVVR